LAQRQVCPLSASSPITLELIELKPDYIETYYERAGMFSAYDKDYDRAIADYGKIIELDGKQVDRGEFVSTVLRADWCRNQRSGCKRHSITRGRLTQDNSPI
jgi:hypothetical protein